MEQEDSVFEASMNRLLKKYRYVLASVTSDYIIKKAGGNGGDRLKAFEDTIRGLALTMVDLELYPVTERKSCLICG